MNQNEMVTRLAAETGFSKAESLRMLKATTAELRLLMRAGQAVTIPDWGTFDTSVHDAHRGFLPNEGHFAMLPKRRVPVFRPCQGMRDEVHDTIPADQAVS